MSCFCLAQSNVGLVSMDCGIRLQGFRASSATNYYPTTSF